MPRDVRRVLLMHSAGLILAGVFVFALSRVFPLVEILSEVQLKVMHLGAWSALCYPLLYACCNVLLLPAGVLSIGGGFFFGLWWGFIIVLLGNVGGAAIAFYISRWLSQRWLQRVLRRHNLFDLIEPAVRRDGWKIILLSQLHPLFPTSLLNYLYGLTVIRFRTCMLWVAIGQAPGLFLYVYIGTLSQVGLNLARGQWPPRYSKYLLLVVGLVSGVIVLFLLGRIAMQSIARASQVSQKPHRAEDTTVAAV